jgi:hypothetical protein
MFLLALVTQRGDSLHHFLFSFCLLSGAKRKYVSFASVFIGLLKDSLHHFSFSFFCLFVSRAKLIYVSFASVLICLGPQGSQFAAFFFSFFVFHLGQKESLGLLLHQSLLAYMPKRKIVLHPCKDFRVNFCWKFSKN